MSDETLSVGTELSADDQILWTIGFNVREKFTIRVRHWLVNVLVNALRSPSGDNGGNHG